MALTFDELSQANAERVFAWFPGGYDDWTPADWAVEMVGEVGEALNVMKKLSRARMGVSGNGGLTVPELEGMLEDELADIAICLSNLCNKMSVDLNVAIPAKFNKTSDKHGFKEKL